MGTVDELSRQGIRVWLMGDAIRVFPRTALTNELRKWIADNREALVSELAEISARMPRPYLNGHGDLVIPFDSPKRYHWWAGGQSVEETKRELSHNSMADDALEQSGEMLTR